MLIFYSNYYYFHIIVPTLEFQSVYPGTMVLIRLCRFVVVIYLCYFIIAAAFTRDRRVRSTHTPGFHRLSLSLSLSLSLLFLHTNMHR